MHRTDGAGNINNLFVGEDPATSRPPTEFTSAWFNDVQENLAGVIEGAGIALVKSDYTQLRAAIQKMIQASAKAVVINNAVFAPAVTGAGKAVYWDAGNARFDLALADGSAKQNAVGFADVPNGNIIAFGDAVLFVGLTPGGRYYLDGTTAGAITTTAPTNAVFMGIAKSATEVFIDIDAQPASSSKQIAPVSAVTSANALIITVPAETLDFRSTTAKSGATNTRTAASAGTLTVPAGATLGTVAGQSARLIFGWLDNAGTLEPFIANLAGGLNLDESTLISTTAVSASSNAQNVIYSAVARTNVPFRVRGFCDISEAVAGTWATDPTLVQGAGGLALAALGALGFGQTYQDVSASRALGTTYYNTSARSIFVSVTGTNSGGNPSGLAVTVAGQAIQAPYFYGGVSNQVNPLVSFLVAPGQSYSVAALGTATISKWIEFR